MPASARTMRARRRLYYAKHREELLLKNRMRYHADPEPRREAARRDYALNVKRRKELAKLRARKNPVDLAAKRKAAANYYAKHRDEILLKRRINYHANAEANRAASRERCKKRRSTLNPKPESGGGAPRYCVKHIDGLVLKLQKVESSKHSEFDHRRQNLEEIVSKIARNLDAASAHSGTLEHHQEGGSIILQDSIELVPTIIVSHQTDCVSHSKETGIVPGVDHRTEHCVQGVSERHMHVQCHNVHVYEVSGNELGPGFDGRAECLAHGVCARVHEDSSAGDLSPRVDDQTDSSLLAKSQQRVVEMLTQLESETTT